MISLSAEVNAADTTITESWPWVDIYERMRERRHFLEHWMCLLKHNDRDPPQPGNLRQMSEWNLISPSLCFIKIILDNLLIQLQCIHIFNPDAMSLYGEGRLNIPCRLEALLAVWCPTIVNFISEHCLTLSKVDCARSILTCCFEARRGMKTR